jgi:cellulose synthase/poly-beta-1,6-N-acetylglucosamine synthase-like glycosyltransferase
MKRLLLVLPLLHAPGLAADPTSGYEALLAEAVRADGVDYAALRKGRAALDAYVRSLEAADPGATDAARIAFWINAYNALTIQQVLDTNPESVRDVQGFFDTRAWRVAGREVTLDAIENGILRKDFREPRIHFALNCASRSCPPLAPELYRGEDLGETLTRQARDYLADEKQNRFDYAGLSAELSMVFQWFREDFEAGRKGAVPPLQLFLADHAPTETLARSLARTRWRISFRAYDWSLNGAGAAERPRGVGIHPFWLVLYGAAALALLLFGLHAFKMLLWRRRHGARYVASLAAARARSDLGRTRFPRVLVQLPLYNEAGVAERAIDAAARLDWPALEIQVLDDSTDETTAAVERAVGRARGVPIAVIRRAAREGFKAGALAAGLARSDAPFVAVFDADFVPAPDFLRRALPLFGAGERVACVQGRWDHLNRGQNWLTRAQAVGIDAHFLVQQLARAARGAFLNFNGTAGVWRREAIEDAGGWRGDTLTEDLDLSYRAQLRGWRIVFDPDLAVRAELPPTIAAYKSQQRRWACGSTQCARLFLRPVWRSRLPLWLRSEATAHLCGYGACLAMMVLVLLVPMGVGQTRLLLRDMRLWPIWAAVWIAAAGPIAVSIAAQRLRPRCPLRFPWADVPACFLLGLGCCANNALAVLRGIVRPIRTFVRTPKQGSLAAPPRARAPVLEQALAVATLVAAAMLFRRDTWTVAAYAVFCAAGFGGLAAYWWLVERRGRAA